MVVTLTVSYYKPSPITSTGWLENIVLASIHSNCLDQYQGGGGFTPWSLTLFCNEGISLCTWKSYITIVIIYYNIYFWSRNFTSCVWYWFTKSFSIAQSLGAGKNHLVVAILLYLQMATVISLTADISHEKKICQEYNWSSQRSLLKIAFLKVTQKEVENSIRWQRTVS